MLLQATDEHVLLAADDTQIVIGELAPLAPNFAPKLTPLAADGVPIHR
jgi:hypothetical protein